MIFGLAFNLSFAQKNIVNQWNGWYIYTGDHTITKKIGLHTEYQWIRSNIITDWQQSLPLLGLNYRTTDNTLLTLGYGYVITYPYGKQPLNHAVGEHDIWEQFIQRQRIGRCYFNHRYRLEQRWMQNFTKTPENKYVLDNYIFRNRARYRFMVSIPLNHKEMTNNTLFLSLYDELFVNIGHNIGLNLFDQNRISATLGWQFNPDLNLQVGYMNQYIQKPNAVDMENNHTVQLWLTYNIDFRKLFPAKIEEKQ